MFPLRVSKSERSLRKLKKASPCPPTLARPPTLPSPLPQPRVDFAAFPYAMPREDVLAPLRPVQPSARTRATSVRAPRRDTLLIDLTNTDLLPALDYAFAILDAEDPPTRSAPSSPPAHPFTPSRSSSGTSVSSSGTSSGSASMPCTPSSPPGESLSPLLPKPPQKPRPTLPVLHDDPFDPHELSRALSHAQADSSGPESPSTSLLPSSPSVPFPPPAAPPAARVPLLQRKPRLHSAESSIDSHDSFISRSYPSPSKVGHAHSVSSLDHYRDVFGSRSCTSLNTIDPGLAALLPQQPRAPSSLKLFPKKSRPRLPGASTPPPARGRHPPSSRPPVPPLPDIFLLGPAARREAVSDSNLLLSRSLM
ncbi:hypothetical protein JB92DRAFT_3112975 [Gautieria morchelliformis]|nr:hypothetical protein JB92DRAFT_3112975 [Gautieria morchelliformis]